MIIRNITNNNVIHMNHKQAHLIEISDGDIVRAGRKLCVFAGLMVLGGAIAYWFSPQFRALMTQTYENLVEAMVIIAAYCT